MKEINKKYKLKVSYPLPRPKMCPVMSKKFVDCSWHGMEKGKHDFCYDGEYLDCPSFSNWFWANISKKIGELIASGKIEIGSENKSPD